MTFDLISGLHMQIQTWHPPLWLCTHATYYVKSGLTNVLKNANKTKNMHLFSIRIVNYYMSAHVLLNLLNELGKSDKMRGSPSILSLFRNEFNKFNNTRARMLDCIYHMALRLL